MGMTTTAAILSATTPATAMTAERRHVHAVPLVVVREDFAAGTWP